MLKFSHCLTISWLYCFPCFTSSLSLTGSYSEVRLNKKISVFFFDLLLFFCSLSYLIIICFTEHPWRKVNSAPVCFGANDNRFGRFEIEVGGVVEAVKLVHLYGLVNCVLKIGKTKWGCTSHARHIRVFVTDASNSILLPMGETKMYTIPGYHSNSTEIVFSGFASPLHISSGYELRLWYDQDLYDSTENNNGGTSCADIFAKYS